MLIIFSIALAGCSPDSEPDRDADLQRLADAAATFEDAVEAGTADEQVAVLAERVHDASDLTPDDTWTDEQRRRLLDLLKRFDGVLRRWEEGEPPPISDEPGVT